MTQTPSQFGHHLVSDIIYGPVHSRRFGTTIGINLLGEHKLCSFDCVYCQLGFENELTSARAHELMREQNGSALSVEHNTHNATAFWQMRFPTKEQVIAALQAFLEEKKDTLPCPPSACQPSRMTGHRTNPFIRPIPSSTQSPLSLVFSGNGEPTLHPDFARIVDELILFRNAHFPGVRMICFTNGTRLDHPEVLQALNKLDEACVKADPAGERVNGLETNNELTSSRTHELTNLVLQSCLVDGTITNHEPEVIAAWLNQIKDLKPLRIDLYTISRQTPHPGLKPVPLDRLNKIRDEVAKVFSCPITVSGQS